MKRLFLKLLLISSPILAVLLLYVWKDPFKVLYHYEAYYKKDDSSVVFSYNRDYIATRTLINNLNRYKYDSYIMGGSRSGYFEVKDWEQHINDTNTYHFNAILESLYGVEKKLQFLDKRNMPIKNILLVLDAHFLETTTNDPRYAVTKDPLTSRESSIRFQVNYVKAFFNYRFLYAYIDWLTSGKIKPYMRKEKLLYRNYIKYDARHNEIIEVYANEKIQYGKVDYYQLHKNAFYTRDSVQRYGKPVIGDSQKALLNSMKNILSKHGTNYKIVISPLYDQIKFSPTDLKILQDIFGVSNVYDFSGINDITNDMHNYYEVNHYRPHAARQIMDSIYAR